MQNAKIHKHVTCSQEVTISRILRQENKIGRQIRSLLKNKTKELWARKQEQDNKNKGKQEHENRKKEPRIKNNWLCTTDILLCVIMLRRRRTTCKPNQSQTKYTN